MFDNHVYEASANRIFLTVKEEYGSWVESEVLFKHLMPKSGGTTALCGATIKGSELKLDPNKNYDITVCLDCWSVMKAHKK